MTIRRKVGVATFNFDDNMMWHKKERKLSIDEADRAAAADAGSEVAKQL